MTETDLQAQLRDLAQSLESISAQITEAAVRRKISDGRLDQIEHRLTAVEEATSNGLWVWLHQHWRIVAVLSVPMPAVLMAMLVGFWQMRGDAVVEFLRLELQEATSNSQILFQPIGLSFVREPVKGSGIATYVLVAKRTEFGAGCTYVDTVPVFTDELGRSLPGPFESRGRQYGRELTRTELRLRVPEGLHPGRVTVVLQIHYTCDGFRFTHETYPVPFEVLPQIQRSD